MPYRRTPETYARWFCIICQSDITRVHKKRHLDSEAHARRAFWLTNPTDADFAFSRFLQNFDPRTFAGVERTIYLAMRRGQHPTWL